MLTDLELKFEKNPYEYKDGKLLFWATGITKDYATIPQIENIFEMATGTKVLYRHRSNADGSGEVHGYIKKAEFDKETGKVRMQIELHEVTEEDKRVLREVVGSIELAQKHDAEPYGVSVFFQTVHKRGDKDQTPVKFHLEEVSITPIPACKECKIELEEKMEEKDMPDDNIDSVFVKTTLENKEFLQKDLAKKQAAFEELSAKYSEMSEANKTLLEKYDLLAEQKETLEKEGVELKSKFESDINGLTAKIEFLEKKKPLLDEIKQHEKSEIVLSLLENEPIETLQKYLEEKKSTPKPHEVTPTIGSVNAAEIATQTMQKTMETAQESADKMFEDDPEMEKVRQLVEKGVKDHGLY